MKSTKGTINEALAQVANYNKEQRPVVEAETLDERETDKYGNPKLSDTDKDRIARIREQISDKQEEVDRLKKQIVSIKKAAGLPV